MEGSTLTTEQLAYRAGRDLEQKRALLWVQEVHAHVQKLMSTPGADFPDAAQALEGLVRNFEEATYRGLNPKYDIQISGRAPAGKDGKELTQQKTLLLLNVSLVVWRVLGNLKLGKGPSKATVSKAILAEI